MGELANNGNFVDIICEWTPLLQCLDSDPYDLVELIADAKDGGGGRPPPGYMPADGNACIVYQNDSSPDLTHKSEFV